MASINSASIAVEQPAVAQLLCAGHAFGPCCRSRLVAPWRQQPRSHELIVANGNSAVSSQRSRVPERAYQPALCVSAAAARGDRGAHRARPARAAAAAAPGGLRRSAAARARAAAEPAAGLVPRRWPALRHAAGHGGVRPAVRAPAAPTRPPVLRLCSTRRFPPARMPAGCYPASLG